jgi:hypothetical protein
VQSGLPLDHPLDAQGEPDPLLVAQRFDYMWKKRKPA